MRRKGRESKPRCSVEAVINKGEGRALVVLDMATSQQDRATTLMAPGLWTHGGVSLVGTMLGAAPAREGSRGCKLGYAMAVLWLDVGRFVMLV